MGDKKLQHWLLVSLYLVVSVEGYPAGPPPTVCTDMNPSHGASEQQTAAPYEIVLPKTTYSPNENIQVSLQGKNGNLFRGFILQPRNNANTDTTYGTINGASAGTNNPCIGKTALAHTNGMDKTSVNFTWIAPAANVGNIVFVYTIVQTKRVYWLTQTSAILTYQATTTPVVQNTTQATTTKTLQNTTQATTTASVQNATQATTTASVQNTTQATTTASVQNATQATTTASVQNATQATTTASVQNTTQATTTASAHDATQATTTASVQNTTQATTTASVQNATQATTAGEQKTAQTSSNASSAMGIPKDGGCGKTVGCFHDCDSSNHCGFLLTWVDKGDNIDLTLSCHLGGGDVYCAIGLSSDDKMGDDSVFECVSSNSSVFVYVSYNDGRSNSRLEQNQLGLSGMHTEQKDGVITCKFSRKKTFDLTVVASGRKKRETASASTYFDMNNDWTLFYAYGKPFLGYLTQHDKTPTLSNKVADFQSVMDISGSEAENKLVKVHGILMTLAWLFFATLGIFMARFYKTVWPKGMECFNQKRWFQVHRACMVLTLLLTAAAFIIIFVDVGGYADMEGDTADNFDKSHPIIGIIIMGLVVINPMMALFRPHPGTPQRPIFNVAHTVVGVLAHVLGIVNLFSGTRLSAAQTPSYVWILLYIFVAWMLLLEVISQLYDKNKKETKANAYEMKNGVTEEYQETAYQSVSRFKLVILGLHVVVLTGLVIAVCVIIGIN